MNVNGGIGMQVKILDAMTSNGLEKKINEFISQNERYAIKDIKVTAGFGSVTALIIYEEASF